MNSLRGQQERGAAARAGQPPTHRPYRLLLAVVLQLGACARAAETARDAAALVNDALPAPSGCVEELEPLRGSDADPRWTSPHLLVLRKSARSLQHFRDGSAALDAEGRPRCWRVGLGFAPTGTKSREGDGKTPEGWYRTSDKPESSFAHAIAVHYPNARDAAAGLEAGTITAKTARQIERAEASGQRPPQETALGGHLLIHGGGGLIDWTLGCAALDDAHLLALRAGLPRDQRAWLMVLP